MVENVFGRLKARWRRLTKRNDVNIINGPHIVTACCVLNNICKMFNDSIPESWLHTDMDQHPTVVSREDTTDETSATIICDTLFDYYSTSQIY